MVNKLSFRETIQDMITSNAGSVSSKVIVGTVTYMVIILALIVMMFVNPTFPGLSDLISISILSSSSLIGLTTIENIRQKRKGPKHDETEN